MIQMSAPPTVERTGLTSDQARQLLDRFGPNDPAPRHGTPGAMQLLLLFANPLVIILLCAATASAFLGQLVDAAIITVMVLLGVAINFVQTYRSHKAVERLRNQVTPTASVERDGAWVEISRREVVPGDLIRLSAGDLVPADAKLVQSRDLFVQQAALTGESMPTEKEVAAVGSEEPEGPESRSRVFLGTSVVSGTATAIVVATGAKTAFGDIADRLAMRPPETEFERGIRHFGQLILRAVFFLVLFIMVVSLALRHDAFESLLFAVALAVGLTPEFLPMITSVTLARGAVKMARQKVIVKHLPAIQNFGSIDVLCSDKTGTLTTGNMALDHAVDPLGAASERALQLAWLNSHFQTGIHSPLDAAILKHDFADMVGYKKWDEIPFDFERRRLSVVVEHPGSGQRLLVTKGAPEGILGLSNAYETGGNQVPFDAVALKRCHATYDELSAKGLRLLAVAYRTVDSRERYSAADECQLTLAGFLAFADPPVADAAELVEDLKRFGVQLKIVTGDSDLVAGHICEEVGLDFGEIVLGDDIARMSDTALDHVAENAHVFARVSPAQKTRILLALKRRGHVVGFMGDGINDAPSLHAADVGISVSTAVDVARDAADIILLEPGLRVLHNGIIEGRRAFGNVTKYLLMGTSSNFGNMFSMAGASLFLPFLPMLPTQILLNNFLYDMAQVTIPSDNVDDEYVMKPQRSDIKFIRNFMVLIGPISSVYDFLTFYVLLHFFKATQAQFHTGWFVESLATQTLVLFVIRTMRSPWRSRPSGALTATTLGIVVLGLLLPYTSLGAQLGFTLLPGSFYAFLAPATVTYLALVEVAKRKLFSPRAI
jgi:P-type Mg2+ transporter